jgi:iron complex transport system substrate-binding protein
MEQAYIKNILSSLKIKHITVDPSSIEELLESIRKIGRITAKTQEANALTADIKTAIKVIGSKFQDIPEAKRPSVYVEIWHDPIMSVGRSSFIDDMVRKAGGKNVTSDLKRCYSRVDAETIIWRDPDVIILTYMKNNIWIKKEFERRLGWKKITAVKNNRVFSDIDPDLIIRPGPRIKEGLQELYKRFYEE